jgi:hypothetical protein
MSDHHPVKTSAITVTHDAGGAFTPRSSRRPGRRPRAGDPSADYQPARTGGP